MTSERSAEEIVREYFARYLPSAPAPRLIDFNNIATFGCFDQVFACKNPRPRGEEKRELIRHTVECLQVVLVEGLGLVAESTEFGPGVRNGETVAHYAAWVEKGFLDPVGDSIRAKCSVFLGPREHPLKFGRLNDSSCVRDLCSAIGCADHSGSLLDAIAASLDLFRKEPIGQLIASSELDPLEKRRASLRAFQDEISAVWAPSPDVNEAESFAGLLTLLKLNDFGSQGSLNERGQMQRVPDALLSEYLELCGTKRPFLYMVAALEYLQDAPVGPNGEVFKFVWKLWRGAARPSREEMGQALTLVLQLIAKKGYHHDISDFKRVLVLAPSDAEAMIENFSPIEQQGCYRALRYLFSGQVGLPYRAKVELVQLLDSSRGKRPAASWAQRLAGLVENGHRYRAWEFASWILSNRHWINPEGSLGWSDDVFKRFVKGAEWMLDG